MEFLGGLHPMVVHFPIALFCLYALTEILGIALNNQKLLSTAFYLLLIGVVSGVIATLTGNQAEIIAETHYPAGSVFPEKLIEDHEFFASLSLWFFMLIAVLRTYLVLKKKFLGRFRYMFIIFAFVGVYLIWTTGTIGGKLVYDFGVGVKSNNILEAK